MATPFTPEQEAKIKAALLTEPCLHHARHYLTVGAHRQMALDTMAGWLNEVGGKSIATAEIVAEILGVPAPDASEPEAAPRPDEWVAKREELGL